LDLLTLRGLPFHTRRNYYYELQHLVFWSVLVGVVESQFGSVVVSRTFGGSDLMIAVTSATPNGAMLFSLVWGMLCVGRPKVLLAMWFVSVAALCTGVIGLIPDSPAGAVWFIGQLAAAQVLVAAVVTVRSAFWKSNYPRSDRGRITARLQGLRYLIGVLTVLGAAAICDKDPASYRWVFPSAALCGAISAGLLSRLHIRGERRELARNANANAKGELRTGLIEPFSLTALLSPGQVIGQMTRVLRDDRRFARYCAAQSLMGLANFLTIPVLVAVVTRELSHSDAWGFWVSTAIIVALPQLTMLGTIGRWGRFLDRFGVVRLRVLNVASWTASLLFGMFATLVALHPEVFGGAALPLAIALFAVRSLLAGLGQGGGAIAWNIGHLHFARNELAEVYMGIHVSLTGIRGLLGPLAGMLLWGWIGWPVWLVAMACSTASLIMYIVMARIEGQSETAARPEP